LFFYKQIKFIRKSIFFIIFYSIKDEDLEKIVKTMIEAIKSIEKKNEKK